MPRGVQWDDLPIEVRHRIAGSRREQRIRAASELPGQRLWQCCACGEVSKSYAAAEKHADDVGHRRIELVLVRVDETQPSD